MRKTLANDSAFSDGSEWMHFNYNDNMIQPRLAVITQRVREN
jgi:hypothetical protein